MAATKKIPDVLIQNISDTIVWLTPVSSRAKVWATKSFGDDRPRMGEGFLVNDRELAKRHLLTAIEHGMVFKDQPKGAAEVRPGSHSASAVKPKKAPSKKGAHARSENPTSRSERGNGYSTSMSKRDIERFNAVWPASNLTKLNGVRFFFDQKGDLVDIEFKNGDLEKWDGEALSALAGDAQALALGKEGAAGRRIDERTWKMIRERYRNPASAKKQKAPSKGNVPLHIEIVRGEMDGIYLDGRQLGVIGDGTDNVSMTDTMLDDGSMGSAFRVKAHGHTYVGKAPYGAPQAIRLALQIPNRGKNPAKGHTDRHLTPTAAGMKRYDNIVRAIRDLGLPPSEMPDWYAAHVETLAGPARISVHTGTPGLTDDTVFVQFSDPARASKMFPGVDRVNGKYNLHGITGSPKERYEEVQRYLSKILPAGSIHMGNAAREARESSSKSSASRGANRGAKHSPKAMRLIFLPANQAHVFVMGATPVRMGEEPLFFEVKPAAIEAAKRQGLAVDKDGLVTIAGRSPNPAGLRDVKLSPGDSVVIKHDGMVYRGSVAKDRKHNPIDLDTLALKAGDSIEVRHDGIVYKGKVSEDRNANPVDLSTIRLTSGDSATVKYNGLVYKASVAKDRKKNPIKMGSLHLKPGDSVKVRHDGQLYEGTISKAKKKHVQLLHVGDGIVVKHKGVTYKAGVGKGRASNPSPSDRIPMLWPGKGRELYQNPTKDWKHADASSWGSPSEVADYDSADFVGTRDINGERHNVFLAERFGRKPYYIAQTVEDAAIMDKRVGRHENPTKALFFKELAIGDYFHFSHDTRSSETAKGEGPWVKVNARDYVHTDAPVEGPDPGRPYADVDTVYTISSPRTPVMLAAKNHHRKGNPTRGRRPKFRISGTDGDFKTMDRVWGMASGTLSASANTRKEAIAIAERFVDSYTPKSNRAQIRVEENSAHYAPRVIAKWWEDRGQWAAMIEPEPKKTPKAKRPPTDWNASLTSGDKAMIRQIVAKFHVADSEEQVRAAMEKKLPKAGHGTPLGNALIEYALDAHWDNMRTYASVMEHRTLPKERPRAEIAGRAYRALPPSEEQVGKAMGGDELARRAILGDEKPREGNPIPARGRKAPRAPGVAIVPFQY